MVICKIYGSNCCIIILRQELRALYTGRQEQACYFFSEKYFIFLREQLTFSEIQQK